MKIVKPEWVAEGVGTKVCRVITGGINLDPFILLDYASVKLPAGFPDHPHRGFQSIFYIKQGRFVHEDSTGHKGIIGPGGVQWITAGKGIIHSEIPASDTETSIGYQMWLNLRKADKMVPPRYQDYTNEEFPVFQEEGLRVKVIAGEYKGKKSPIQQRTKCYYIDTQMGKGKVQTFAHGIGTNSSAIIFVQKGSIKVNGEAIKFEHAALIEKTPEAFTIEALQNSEYLLMVGEKLGEHIENGAYRFVMSSKEEVEEAFEDFKVGRNGFQNKDWQSKNKQLMGNPQLPLAEIGIK